MRVRNLIFGITTSIFCLVPCCLAQGNNPVERIFYNAKIFTAEPQRPFAEALAIRGDKIVAVGNKHEAMNSVGKNAERIDLHGRRLLPGLIDSHIHAIYGGLFQLTNVSDNVQSVSDLAAFAAGDVKSGRGVRDHVLMITGIPLSIWLKTDELNAQFSGGLYESMPVFLLGSDGHTGWGNKALRLRAGLTKDFIAQLPEAERKNYGLGSDLEPNGFGVDSGLTKIVGAVGQPSRQELLAGGQSAVHYLNSLGITAWLDARAGRDVLTAYRDLSEAGNLTAHVAAFPVVTATKETDEDPLARVQALRKQFSGVPNLTIPGIKIYADGVAEYPSQTADMSAPYKNSGKYGELLFDPLRFAEIVTAADKQGLIVHIHAIGDKAVTESLNGIEAARKANGNSGLPHTIAHLQFVLPSNIPRFKKLGVIADLQLLWASANSEAIDLIKPYIDPTVFRWEYPARSLLNASATISGGSDWYVSSPNVFLAIYKAETRNGPEGVLNATERMPRMAMLYAYTRNAALAMHELDKIGSIVPGKEADFVVLDRDVLSVPAEELKGTKVLWTILGGKTVFGSDPTQ